MAEDKRLEAGLKMMAVDFRLPGGGRMKLSRLVTKHLDWFEAAERRGMGWRDMTIALAAAGVARPTEKRFSVGTLSSTVWRIRAKAGEEEIKRIPQRRSRIVSKQVGLPVRPATPERPKTSSTVSQITDPASLASPKKLIARHYKKPKSDVLAFMDRARAVREKPEES